MVGVEEREKPEGRVAGRKRLGGGGHGAFACFQLVFKASCLTVHPKPRWVLLQARDLRSLAFVLVLLHLLSATWEGSVRWAGRAICLAARGSPS